MRVGISSFRRYECYVILAMLALIVAAVVVLPSADFGQAKSDISGNVVVGVVTLFGVTFAALELRGASIQVDGDMLKIVGMMGRTRLLCRTEDVQVYESLGSESQRITAGSKSYRLYGYNIAEQHRLMLGYVPHALKYRRIHSTQTPPDEDFIDISRFDTISFAARVIASFVFAGIISMQDKGVAGAFMGVSILRACFQLKDLFGGISITSQGLKETWLGGQTSIDWDEIIAIFCDGTAGDRRFTVLGRTNSIVLPRGISRELEYMRKFFYSLPDGTLCVNFPDDYGSGYRVRTKKGKKASSTLAELRLET